MKRIYVIESLCNGCRLCETFCSSLSSGVFGPATGRITVVRTAGEAQDIPLVECDGRCIRPLYDTGESAGEPTCVAVCPTGALIYEEREEAAAKLRELELARKAHGLFKVVAPWKWPMPWRMAR